VQIIDERPAAHNRFLTSEKYKVLGNAGHLRITITGVVDCQRILWCAGLMEPLVTVDSQVVCFFVRSDENTNLNFVILVGSQERREWIARLHVLSQRRIKRWLHVELR